jgi:hypothetical protein
MGFTRFIIIITAKVIVAVVNIVNIIFIIA